MQCLLQHRQAFTFMQLNYIDLPSSTANILPVTNSLATMHYSRFVFQYETRLYEDYLAIIIYVVYERYYDGIGHVTFEEQARREIIHALASGPKPHSKVQKAISHQVF